MQRLITLDSVIYVHQNPQRRRRMQPVEVEEEETGAGYSEPSADWSPEPLQVEPEAVAVAEAAIEAETEAEPLPEPEPEPEPAPIATFDGQSGGSVSRQRVARSLPMAAPRGYAIEFGTGRLVPIHSYKGRMSYPGS